MKSILGTFLYDQYSDAEAVTKLIEENQELKNKVAHYERVARNYDEKTQARKNALNEYRLRLDAQADVIKDLRQKISEQMKVTRKYQDRAADLAMRFTKMEAAIKQIFGENGLNKVKFYFERR